jgi:hypothetical protein
MSDCSPAGAKGVTEAPTLPGLAVAAATVEVLPD